MSPDGAALLVVDDNEDNLYTLTQRLRREGYTSLTTARDGRQALELLRAQPFDLVLLDVMMPELNGYQVLEALRGRRAAPARPRDHDLGRGRARERHPLHRAGRGGLPAEALQPDPPPGPHRRLPREEAAPRPARRVDPDAGGARPREGRGGRAARPAQALLLAAAGRAHRGGRRGRPAQDPPPRGHRRVPRPAGVHGVRGDLRAGGGHAGAPRVPRRDGPGHPRARGDARAVHRATA